MRKGIWQWLLPILLFLIFLPFSSPLDLKLSQLCYTSSPENKGHFIENGFTHFVYHYGEWPAFLICDGSFLLLLLSFFVPAFKKWRRPCLVLTLTFFLGAGLLVNGILKEHIERARPRQIQELGGQYSFRPIYKPHFIKKQLPDGQKSCPSGHVSTGAYFFALIFISRRIFNRLAFYSSIIFTALWTILLMVARIMQGAHFLSDTLAAILLMWLIALFMDWLFWESTWVFLFHRKKQKSTDEI